MVTCGCEAVTLDYCLHHSGASLDPASAAALGVCSFLAGQGCEEEVNYHDVRDNGLWLYLYTGDVLVIYENSDRIWISLCP